MTTRAYGGRVTHATTDIIGLGPLDRERIERAIAKRARKAADRMRNLPAEDRQGGAGWRALAKESGR